MAVLPQLRLFEMEDQRWLPNAIRDGITEYLSWLGNASPEPYRPFVQSLAAAMEATGDDKIVDLCAGASGPWETMFPLLAEHGLDPTVTLTDLFPNLDAFEVVKERLGDRVRFEKEPIDATACPAELEGFRVVFNAFHHFKPELAKDILRDAVEKRRGIAIFEGVERTIPSVLTCSSSVLLVLLATPFLRRVSAQQLLLTYALPVVPLFAAWDGIASSFRCYTVEQLLEMGHEVAPDYKWEAARCPVKFSPLASTYLIGTPPPRVAFQVN